MNQTKFYGNHELCILTTLVRKSESLREIIFLFQGTNFVCHDATNWRSPVRDKKQKPYKLCRSKPWHNQTTSSGWEYKHLSTASTALLENSPGRKVKTKSNFYPTLRSMVKQCRFHNGHLHWITKRHVYLVYKCRICYKLLGNTSHIHNYVYIGKRTFSSRRDPSVLKRSKKYVQRDQDKRATEIIVPNLRYYWNTAVKWRDSLKKKTTKIGKS